MADLSILLTAENQRVRDWVYGAARNTQVDRASGHLDTILKLTDTATAQLVTVLQAGPAAEAPRVLDFVFGAARTSAVVTDRSAGLMDVPKVADTVTAKLDLLVVITAEALKVTDTPATRQLDPLQAAAAAEVAKADDGALIAQPTVLEKAVTDAAKLADTVTPGLTPLVVAVSSEALKSADTIGVARGLTVVVTADGLSLDDTEYLSLQFWPPTLIILVTRRGYYQGGMGADPSLWELE